MEWLERRIIWRCTDTLPGIRRGTEKLDSWSLCVGLNSSLNHQGGFHGVIDQDAGLGMGQWGMGWNACPTKQASPRVGTRASVFLSPVSYALYTFSAER